MQCINVVYKFLNISETMKKTCLFSKTVALNNQNIILDSKKNANANEQMKQIVAPSSIDYSNKTIDDEINKQTIQLW